MGQYSDIVRAHHKESDGVLVAGREPCITIAYEERENVSGRSFTVVPVDEIHRLEVRESWFMGLLLCPGDTTVEVRDWFFAGDHDPQRIVFYLHSKTKPRTALSAWHEAGLPVYATWTINSWQELHKHFGNHWNNQVYVDHRHLYEG